MKTTGEPHGKISDHFKGMGTVTRDMVVARAREVALINGHHPNRYTKEDFAEAMRELTGAIPDADDGEAGEESIAGLVTWNELPEAAGVVGRKDALGDEPSCAAQLVEEGVEEAWHEQMVEGARNPRNQE
jgi:hypothetical protein